MKGFIKCLMALYLISCYSCKKVIQVNLNDASPRVVILGEVTNEAGPYQVTVAKTVNFSLTNRFPAVSGALITITDSTGLNDTLMETDPGTYNTHISWRGIPGNTYHLTVTTVGQTYKSASTMPQPVTLDSIGFQYNGSFSGKTTISVVPYYQDPAGVANYYQFTENINRFNLNKIYVFNDEFSNGRYIHEALYDDSVHIKRGDTVILNMYSVDANVFQYLNTLMQITNNFQAVTPANPNSNISNGALGYFNAHTFQSLERIAP